MTESDHHPDSLLAQAVERAERLEKALPHLTAFTEFCLRLELADQDPGYRPGLLALGQSLTRISQLSSQTAGTIYDTLGTESEASHGGRADASERRKLKEQEPVSRLYLGLLPVSEFPQADIGELVPVEFEIIDDYTLMRGGETIRLDGHQLFVFNALLLLRNQLPNKADIQGLGFRQGSTPGSTKYSYSHAMRVVRDKLNQAAGTEVIAIHGGGPTTYYVVSPALVLHDRRSRNEDGTDDIPAPQPAEKEGREDAAAEVSATYEILDGNTVDTPGGQVQLTGEELFVFKVLRSLGDGPATADKIKRHGFPLKSSEGARQRAFSKAWIGLCTKINRAAGADVLTLTRTGRHEFTYAFDAAAVAVERREDEAGSSSHPSPVEDAPDGALIGEALARLVALVADRYAALARQGPGLSANQIADLAGEDVTGKELSPEQVDAALSEVRSYIRRLEMSPGRVFYRPLEQVALLWAGSRGAIMDSVAAGEDYQAFLKKYTK